MTWPQSLQTVLRILVTSRYAMWLGWGAGAHVLLQRRLCRDDAWRQASVGARPVGPPRYGRRSGRISAHAARPSCAPARRPGTRACCCSWSATAIPRRPTTPSRTARCRTTPARRRHAVRRHRGHRARHRRTPAGHAARTGRRRSPRCGPSRRCCGDRDARSRPISATCRSPLTWLFDADARPARLACVTGIARGHPIAAPEIDIAGVSPPKHRSASSPAHRMS